MLEFIGLSLLHVYHSVFVLSLFIYCCLFIRLERRSKSLSHLVVPLGLVTYLYSCISHHPSIHWFWLVSSVYTASTSKYEFSRHYSYCGEHAYIWICGSSGGGTGTDSEGRDDKAVEVSPRTQGTCFSLLQPHCCDSHLHGVLLSMFWRNRRKKTRAGRPGEKVPLASNRHNSRREFISQCVWQSVGEIPVSEIK